MDLHREMNVSSPHQDVRLPESVERIIKRICDEKKQPPLRKDARSMLAEIGEKASMELLSKILSTTRAVNSFTGYVIHLVKSDHKAQAPKSLAYSSPSVSPRISSHTLDRQNLQSPSSNFQRRVPQNLRRELSFDDETREMMDPGSASRSSLAGGVRETAESKAMSQQLMILSKLEFRRLFLVLSYIGGQKLEAVVTLDGANEIFSMKDIPMEVFETQIWNKYGHKYCGSKPDRSLYLGWDSGKTHIYSCHVCKDGSYSFKGPYLNSTRTHLQRSLGDDKILAVKFSEDGEYLAGQFVEEGICVGPWRYRFFVFKDERKRVKKNQRENEKTVSYSSVKCYFIRTESFALCGYDENFILSRKKISEARSLFMHIHTVSTLEKYIARFSLILSKTVKLEINFDAVSVERIEDIPFQDEKGSIILDEDDKPIWHTDGTGYISEDLAMMCPKDFSTAKAITDNSFEKQDLNVAGDIASQKRIAETRTIEPLSKELFLLIERLKPGTIQVRPSMIKVERDEKMLNDKTFNSLEIVAISNRPHRNYLSKHLIALLSYGGVPQEVFFNLLTTALEETQRVYSHRRAALRASINHDGLDYAFVATRMISAGIPLNEPYLQFCLLKLEMNEKTKLKEGKIPVSESFYLMGTADPTGVLNYDEVCVILENGQISGPVLVYRNPGMHFGDVHVMKAVYVNELEEVVGNAKFGIFFTTKGCRSAAYEMATGDFDGDMYWVSRNPELLKYFKASEPWNRQNPVPDSEKRNPQDFSDMELERQLFKLFLEARRPSFNMATTAESWLTFMDRLLTLGDDRATEKNNMTKKMIQLVDIYYDALDAPKSGKKVKVPKELKAEMFPHYMERKHDLSYHSSSVLGQIYDRVVAYKNELVLQTEIWKLPCFDTPIPEEYIHMWKTRYESYRKEMQEALSSGNESKNDAANEVIKKYKHLLYDAPEMEESAKKTEMIYMEAVAIYHVIYDYAMSHGVERCSFAWKVAGSALCNYFAWGSAGPKEKPLTILPSVLRDLMH
ncbi:hypothetical protein CASFOL_030892 [Castilleja foliolosa]|uniref:RNA-dependent RNA polymerase n=1 Tax=Castilleja foliolosa TaxID=1961234 RepID=A0ABD3C6L6_9LAMI